MGKPLFLYLPLFSNNQNKGGGFSGCKVRNIIKNIQMLITAKVDIERSTAFPTAL